MYCTYGHDDDRHPMIFTDYAQLLILFLITDEIVWLCASFIDSHLVPYECTSMGLVVIEASMWLL